MWKPGSMGHVHGWHWGQARDMMDAMRGHNEYWHYQDQGSDIVSSFLNSFAERMGDKAADAIVGDTSS